MAQHNDLGILGEQAAVNYLQKNGYTVLEKNWRYKKAEIDVIALYQNTLVCIEVKTRSSLSLGEPQNFVTPKKVKLLIQAINQYVIVKELSLEIRFDIISIVSTNKECKINHIENAFYHF